MAGLLVGRSFSNKWKISVDFRAVEEVEEGEPKNKCWGQQLTVTASRFSLQAQVLTNDDRQKNILFLQKTDLQLSSKNVLQFYSSQKPERREFDLLHKEKKKRKKKGKWARFRSLHFGTAALMLIQRSACLLKHLDGMYEFCCFITFSNPLALNKTLGLS